MLKIMALPAADKAARALHEAGLPRPVLGFEPLTFASLTAILPLSADPLLRMMALLPQSMPRR